MDVYGKRMLDYVHSAPKSSLCIVYFNSKQEPIVTDRLATVTLPNGQYYISCGPKGFWSFTYKVSDIQHLIYRNKTDVHAFIGHESSGGARFDMAGIGNHITVALKKQNETMFLYTHLTSYTERFSNDGSYIFDIEHSPHFNFEFKEQEAFDKNTSLVPNKYVKKGTFADAYQDEPHWLDVITEIHNVYQGRTKVQHGGYHKQNGRRYKVHAGPRGGRYILQNGERKYLAPKANNVVKLQEVAQFLYENVVKQVVEHYRANTDEIDAKLLFDEEHPSSVVLIYDMPDVGTRHVYYLGVDEIIADAHNVLTTSEIRVKYEQICENHIQEMEVM